MSEHFTTIPATHTTDSTLTAALFVARKVHEQHGPLESWSPQALEALTRRFVEEFYANPDHVSLAMAWQYMDRAALIFYPSLRMWASAIAGGRI